MPGMVNTHCHLGMIPFRGLGDDCKDRLRVFLLPMEQKAMSGEWQHFQPLCNLRAAAVRSYFRNGYVLF